MAKRETKSVRRTITISQENFELIETYANIANLPVSQFMGMACLAGAKQIMRAVAPEKMLTPSEWAAILKAAGGSLEDVSKLAQSSEG